MHVTIPSTISIAEVRKDLPGFFQRIAQGEVITVISHSKPLVTVAESSKKAGNVENVLKKVEEFSRKIEDCSPSHSSKKDYYEALDKKYGIS